jgi:hypothetical protein
MVQAKARASYDKSETLNDVDDVVEEKKDEIVYISDINLTSTDSTSSLADHIIGPMPTGAILPGCPTLGAVFSAAGTFTSGAQASSQRRSGGGGGGGGGLFSPALSFSTRSNNSEIMEARIQRSSIGCAVFGKNELDGVSKDRKHRAWPQDVQLSITYSLLGVPSSEGGSRLPHMYIRSVL